MIPLDNAGTRKLQLITAQNGASVVVGFSDFDTVTRAYDRGVPQGTLIVSAVTTDVCATPAANKIRDVDYISIKSSYAGAHAMTVQIASASGGPFLLIKASLLVDECLEYTHGSGWKTLDASGQEKVTLTGTAGAFSVGGALTVTGDTALNGANLTTTAATVTAFAGATTLLTLGGTGATSVVAIPGTLDATSPTAASLKTAGGFAAAKAIIGGSTIQATTGIAVGAATPGTGGVAFPATAVAVADANTLDDYEENTWTPSLEFGAATTGITYSEQSGTYTKIGRFVHVQGQFTLTNKGSATGSATISGLPFSASATDKGGAIGYMNAITFANAPLLLIQIGTSIQFYEVTESGTPTTLTNADFANNSRIGFSASYFT